MENSFREVLAGISQVNHYYYDQINNVLDYIYEILEEKGLTEEDLNKALNLEQDQEWSDLLEADFFRGVTQIEVALQMQILVITRKIGATRKGENSQTGGFPQPSSLVDNLKPGKSRVNKTQTPTPEVDKSKKSSRVANNNLHAYLTKAGESNKVSFHQGKSVRSKNKKDEYNLLSMSQYVSSAHLRK